MYSIQNVENYLISHQKTWLITGVAGFIGSHLLERLLKLNQIVIGVDNYETGFKENITQVLTGMTSAEKNNFYFHEADIRDYDICQKIAKGSDFILHQAALGSVPRSIKSPDKTHETNNTGFLNILMAAKNAKVKRFVYASSSSVYGDSNILPKKEDNIGNPLSPYAVTKYSNELYAKAFANCYQIETIGLRYFNVFGLRQSPHGPYAAVIPLWINALKNNETITINGDGHTTRDFCYVENAIQANLLAATCDKQEAINEVYNVAFGQQNSLTKLYELIVQNFHPNYQGQPIYKEFRTGDIRHSLADISKAQQLLNYQPSHTLEKGLEAMSLHINQCLSKDQ